MLETEKLDGSELVKGFHLEETTVWRALSVLRPLNTNEPCYSGQEVHIQANYSHVSRIQRLLRPSQQNT